GRRGQRRWISGPARFWGLLRVEGRGDQLSRKPARRACWLQRRRDHTLSWIHCDADDRKKSLSHALSAVRRRGGAANRARDQSRAPVLCIPVADGVVGPCAASTSAASL